MDPADFPAPGGRLPREATRCPVAEKAAFEEAVAKIRTGVDERHTAEHRLVRLESMSRAQRDRAMREGL